MPNPLRCTLPVLLITTLSLAPLSATCGGGGGGGMGGVQSTGGRPSPTYQVPWTVLRGGQKPAPTSSLVLYWFPSSPTEARGSDLQSSRTLSLLTARCVAMAIVPTDNSDLYGQYAAGQHPPIAVLAASDGKEIARLAGDGSSLTARQVEKLLDSEIKRREGAAGQQLDTAKQKAKAGDVEGAASLYQTVWSERCLLPDSGRKAAKGLRDIGRPVPEKAAAGLPAAEPRINDSFNARMTRLLARGLAAEEGESYARAAASYARAHSLDPADPVPLRYLGELERHHTGNWTAARRLFGQILAMPADSISRAVALHGMGKMTIHDGDNAGGVALLEQSIATYPIALAYRNLAVFWNTEGEVAKAQGFAEQALALDPEDIYTQIFVAAFRAEDGHREEALQIAHAHEDLLAASYNLAAIHALLGHRDQALALLARHFNRYEKYDAVRAKEMKEARDDIVFDALKEDPAFVSLTAKAEVPQRPATMAGGRR
jgi:tetratricopeptide (TPR) repeat protein